ARRCVSFERRGQITVAVAMAIPVAVPIAVAVAVRSVALQRGIAVARMLAGLVRGKRGTCHRLEKARETKPYFRRSRRLAPVAAAEDDVFHLVAPQALGALLAHHPRDRIGDVALAASVGADNRGHPLVERQLGAIGKRFEAVDFRTFKPHGTPSMRMAGARRSALRDGKRLKVGWEAT